MLSGTIDSTFLKSGVDSLKISAEDIYDRIINLRFIRKSQKSFTIRSDYEPFFHNDGGNGSISFKKCTFKPDIKVTYKQVSENVAIEVDIRIANFFTADDDNPDVKKLDAASEDPVMWCIIQMGYRGQFPDWTKADRNVNIQQFWDLNNSAISMQKEVQNGRQILVQILTGYAESYPPDRVVYFKGIIGTMEKALRWNHTAQELQRGYGDAALRKADFSEIEETLFQFITRRFIRPSVLHFSETKEIGDIQNREYTQKVTIYDGNMYEDVGSDPVARLLFNLRRDADVPDVTEGESRWVTLTLLESGIMSVRDANKYGVICVVSKTLRSMKANALYGYRSPPGLFPIPAVPFCDQIQSLGGQLVKIQQHFPFLRWYILSDGSYYFYHVNEKAGELWEEPFIKVMRKEKLRELPAIYDMTPAGTRTIRYPFFTFIDPLMTVKFQSRFTIGSFVGFFYPIRTNTFLVIMATVEFATVQYSNTMELMCVDCPAEKPKKEILVEKETTTDEAEPDTVAATASEEPEQAVILVEEEEEPEGVVEWQQERNLAWIEQRVTVAPHITTADTVDSSWEKIVRNNMVVENARWTDAGLPVPGEREKMLALKEWNPEYFDTNGEYMQRTDGDPRFADLPSPYAPTVNGEPPKFMSVENRARGIYGRARLDFHVPWLRTGDIITLRQPFQPEYPEEQKREVMS